MGLTDRLERIGGDRWLSNLDAFAGSALAATALITGLTERDHLGSAFLLAAVGSTVIWRRRSPVTACAVAVAAASVARLVTTHVGQVGSGLAAAAFLLDFFSLGSRAVNQGRTVRMLSASLVAIPLVLLVGFDQNGPADAFASWLLFVALPSGAGWVVATRTALVAALAEEAAFMQREEQEQLECLARQERLRVARELHDIVAHSVSVMVIQAAGARSAASRDVPAARRALATVERCGQEGLEEMDQLISMLESADCDPEAPTRGLSALDGLVARTVAAGVPVTVSITGSPQSATPGIELVAYRVIQEVLTNVVKHAGIASVQVNIGYRGRVLDIEVVDDGCGTEPAGLVGPPAGRGLTGIRERVALYGGEVTTGAGPSGRGFRVHARLPIEPEVSR
jgi:signal transduction histidine kinase